MVNVTVKPHDKGSSMETDINIPLDNNSNQQNTAQVGYEEYVNSWLSVWSNIVKIAGPNSDPTKQHAVDEEWFPVWKTMYTSITSNLVGNSFREMLGDPHFQQFLRNEIEPMWDTVMAARNEFNNTGVVPPFGGNTNSTPETTTHETDVRPQPQQQQTVTPQQSADAVKPASTPTGIDALVTPEEKQRLLDEYNNKYWFKDHLKRMKELDLEEARIRAESKNTTEEDEERWTVANKIAAASVGIGAAALGLKVYDMIRERQRRDEEDSYTYTARKVADIAGPKIMSGFSSMFNPFSKFMG